MYFTLEVILLPLEKRLQIVSRHTTEAVGGNLGVGTSGFVQAIVTTETSIFAGGNFVLAGGETVNRISSDNRSSAAWESLGNGVSGNVNAMVHDGTYLYTDGNFETAAPDTIDNYRVNNVARWSVEKGWEALGSSTVVGIDTQMNAFAFSSDQSHLYAGGNFQKAGTVVALSLAVWSMDSLTYPCIIIPYVSKNNMGTKPGAKALVSIGDQVSIEPQSEAFGTASGNCWSWKGPNGFASNEREIQFTVILSDQTGTYTVTHTEENRCTASFDFILEVTEEPAETERPDAETGILIYPNPSSVDFTYAINRTELNRLALHTISGQLIHSVEITAENYKLEVDKNLSPGIYLVSLTYGDGTTDTKKILVKWFH